MRSSPLNAVPQNAFAHEVSPVLPAVLGSPYSEPKSPTSVDLSREARRLTTSKELPEAARRLRGDVQDMKQLVSSRLAFIQGQMYGVPKIVLGNRPPARNSLSSKESGQATYRGRMRKVSLLFRKMNSSFPAKPVAIK